MSFSGIKGQDRPIRMLKDCLAHSSLGGGYLFSGPEGVGKRLTAIALAKALNCENAESGACGGRCAACRKIENNQHPDFHLITAEGADIKIEQVRHMQQRIGLRPYEGRFKVFIIDNAHRLTAEASNALLKVLEEPPGDSLIILVSDKPELIFKTVLSRCKQVKFSSLEREALERLFREDYRMDKDTAHFLAYFSEGRLGCGLKMKEGGGALREKNSVIDGFLFSRKQGQLDLPSQEKEDVFRYMNILAAWFRDVYLLKAGMNVSQAINSDRLRELKEEAGRLSVAELNRAVDSISESIYGLERNLNIKLILYNLKVQLCNG